MTRILTSLLLLTPLSAFAQPASRPAFDVASIKPSQPGRERIEHAPGSLTMRNVRLAGVIRWAYDLPEFRVSGPGWMNDTWFDILAKAATPVEEPELRSMLRTLLEDRFHLETHRQPKEMSALVLT